MSSIPNSITSPKNSNTTSLISAIRWCFATATTLTHDKKDLECDIVIALHDGRWAAVEVKMGMHEEEDAAKHLCALANDIDEQKMRKPSFLMILTAGQYAYQRTDGVYVMPIGCLKP